MEFGDSECGGFVKMKHVTSTTAFKGEINRQLLEKDYCLKLMNLIVTVTMVNIW